MLLGPGFQGKCVELSNTYSVISWPLTSLLSVSLTTADFVGVIIARLQGYRKRKGTPSLQHLEIRLQSLRVSRGTARSRRFWLLDTETTAN